MIFLTSLPQNLFLASDAKAMRKSGRAFSVGELARECGFTDFDGRRVPPFTLPSFEMVLEDY